MSLEAGGPPAPPRRTTFVMTGKLEVVTEQDTPHEGRHLHGDWNSEALVQAGLPRTVMYSHYLLPGRPDTNVRTAGVLPPSGAYAGHLIMSGLDGLSATPEVMTLIFTSVGPERCIVEGRGSNCIGAFVMTGAGALVSSSEHKLEWKIKLGRTYSDETKREMVRIGRMGDDAIRRELASRRSAQRSSGEHSGPVAPRRSRSRSRSPEKADP